MPKILVSFEMNTEDFDADLIDLNDSTGLSNAGFELLTDQLSEHGDNIEFKLEPQSPIVPTTPDRRLKKKKSSGTPGNAAWVNQVSDVGAGPLPTAQYEPRGYDPQSY